MAFAATYAAFADSTDASWQYVSPIPSEWRGGAKGSYFDATGVITNGDWKLFAKRTGTSLSLSSYSGSADYVYGGAYLSGAGQLDLSKPIYVEGTSERLYVTVMPTHNFSGITSITEFIAPHELTTLKGYNFYLSGSSYPQMTNAVFICPDLAYIGDGVFRFCTKLTSITIRSDALENIASRSDAGTFAYLDTPLKSFELTTTHLFKYGDSSFAGNNFVNLTASDFSFEYVTSVGNNAFERGSGSGLGGNVNLASLQTLGTKGFRLTNIRNALVGYDNLVSVGEDAFWQNSALSNIVIGSGPQPLVLRKNAFAHPWNGGSKYRVFFRGDAPDASQLAAGEYAFYDEHDGISSHKRGRFYIPYGNATWDAVIAAAQPCSQADFNADYPGDDAPVIGLIPARTIGNFGTQYLCYGDYRAEESDIIVTAEPYATGTVSPAYGRNWQYAAGDTVPLVAPEGVLTNGTTLLRVSRYVVETIDRIGRWTNPVTNAYEKGASSVTLPVSGASLRVTWLFDEQYRIALAPRMTADYPEEVSCSVELDANGQAYVDAGATVTFTALAESPELPKTRFVRWEGDVDPDEATNCVLTLAADRAKNVRAVFSHGWKLTSTDAGKRITDGVWTLRVNSFSDLDGQHRLCVGDSWESWATAWVSYSGSLGQMDLSSPIEDENGETYVVTKLGSCAMRGDSGVVAKTALRDVTVPTNLTSVGVHIFLGNTGLTNFVMNCPKITNLPMGFARGCTAMRRLVFRVENLETIDGSNADYTPFRTNDKVEEFDFYAPKLVSIPKYFMTSPLNRTDASSWRLDSVTNIMDNAFDNSGCSNAGGPTGTLRLPSLVCLTGPKQFYGWSRLAGIQLGSGNLRNLGTEVTSTQLMSGLERIELGLAADNDLRTRLFENAVAGTLTNVTFTAAPPANANLFTSFDGIFTSVTAAKTLSFVADFDQPGWTAEYLADMGIDTQATDEEATELAKLPFRERRWFRGVVWSSKRYAWLFARSKALGLEMIIR